MGDSGLVPAMDHNVKQGWAVILLFVNIVQQRKVKGLITKF